MTIREFIDCQDESIRPRLNAIYDTIRAVIPEAEERLSWGMPTFWKDHNIIHFSPAKNHIGLYPGSEAVAFFAPRLTEYKTSKGAIRLPNDRGLPLELIAEIARWCWETNRR